MRPISFRIKNFRSIENSGECFFEPDITILAGKNESGKSNILQALEKFSSGKFEKSDIDLNSKKEINIEISVKFQIEKTDFEQLGLTNRFDLIQTSSLVFDSMKNFDGKKLSVTISGPFFDWYAENFPYEIQFFLDDFKELRLLSKINLVDSKNDKTIEELLLSCNNELIQYELLPVSEKINNKKSLLLENKKDQIAKYLQISNQTLFSEKLGELLPKFILFDSFIDILPDKYTFNDSITPFLERFFKVMDINPIDLFEDTDNQSRASKTDKLSASITGNFKTYYSQDTISINVRLDGNSLCFYIKDENSEIKSPFRPSQRSKGFQWFLAFYITLYAEEKNKTILLIDEPGLYLHAKAQKDVLSVLAKLSKEKVIVFSTHSPYLIDANKLGKVRLAIKQHSKDTIILNKYNKGADKETLTPIITAIGMDINNDLSVLNSKNLLVEGITDYYYLTGMDQILKTDICSTIRIIPCIGASQIRNLASILLGWGLKFVCLFDNDKAGNKERKDLSDNYLISDSSLLLVSEENDNCIEDLFSKNDFQKLILENYEVDKNKKNSEVFKELAVDTIKSKLFYDMITDNGIQVDDETKTNFSSLLSKIKESFEKNP